MPKETKQKKAFKAVTEEVPTQTEVAVPQTAETTAPSSTASSEQVKTSRSALSGSIPSVKETDNMDLTSKPPENGTFLKIFLVTFFATLLAFLLAGGIYVYLTGTKGINTIKLGISQTPLSSPVSTLAPSSASPSANIDLTSFKISVLNGNGGIGVATAAKTIIEKAGFTVSSVGNADNFNFTDTMIQVKASVSADIVAKLKNALSTNYSVKIGSTLDPASNFDIVVTVGSS